MGTPLIIANWKMKLSDGQAIDLARTTVARATPGFDLVLCPSFTALAGVAGVLAGTTVAWGAQDCAPVARGSLTGEVSPDDLVALGCRYVIVGHSERRHVLHEDDATIARKLASAFASGLQSILCIGETEGEWRGGEREAVLVRQLDAALEGLELAGVQQFLIAYEPVWAIGTGQAAAPDDVGGAHAFIADHVAQHRGASMASRTRILYGGSVDASNIRAFLELPHVDGVLVGTASQSERGLRALMGAVTG